ncbi:hypothetical protein LO772_28840 [Yinghuangia sp. ASG 101]|uniref:allene oxide cyclase barrel-like domain-containing protein n=1 Tax=Yinghuangia sp. ASG 101 TaxID=2896848 RepID=UPI001E31A474|nr:hypothetical protein [Yinghuangia sp. ASG 101]UGQ10788.1 hypothetical protein LO772_28840 [Yinghuangia sp. ASG 101]
MLRTISIAATAAVAAVIAATPSASAAETTEYRAVVVGGGKPLGVVEGQSWGTYAMVRDAAGKQVGDDSVACVVEKTRDTRVIAKCTHTLRVPEGSLIVQGIHHYRDQTVMPGTADPMRLMIVRGSGAYAGASGSVDVVEAVGGYTYTFGPTG